MGESLKAVCLFLIIAASIATAVAWSVSRPDALTWGFRIGAPLVGLIIIAFMIRMHRRKDLAPDYLREHAAKYFNRDGFCFAPSVSATDGHGFMDLHFQNQRDSPCVGRVAVRPLRGVFTGRAAIDAVTYEIECAPGAYGVASIAIPIPAKRQGKSQAFEIGASVDHPEGRGRTLRHFAGTYIRTNTKFGSGFATALALTGAAGGMLVFSQPTRATVELPKGVSEEVPKGMAPEVVTLWRCGDPPLLEKA